MHDDRVILLTPPGAAAIAVVRITGKAVSAFLRSHFSVEVTDGRPVHATLKDGETVIDDAVVVTSAGGAVADLNVHGGPWIVRSVIELARRDGFEVIETITPPLPHHAVDCETMLEREVLSSLPLARTELGLRALLGQPDAWAGLKRDLRERTQEQAAAALRDVLDDDSLSRLLHPARVAIVGAPNVGKSTLANRLFAQERSITADVPGTTRDWVGEIANVDGVPVMLLDTPGVRETPDEIERTAIDRSRREVAAADLVVLVLDVSRPLESEQAPLLREFPGALLVANKSDRPTAWDTDRCGAIRTVGTTGGGVDGLRRQIVARLGCADTNRGRARCWTARQRDIVTRALTDRGALDEL